MIYNEMMQEGYRTHTGGIQNTGGIENTGIQNTEHRDTEHRKTETSAVAEHAWECDHQVDWNAGKVLDVEQRWGKQCMLAS